jgi:hypothetical protein
MIVLLLIHIAIGFTLSILAIPLMQGSVPQNRWYGFRTKRTLADRELWYAANAYMGKWLLIMGVGIIGAAFGLYLVPGMDTGAYAFLATTVVIALTILLIVQSYQYLIRH